MRWLLSPCSQRLLPVDLYQIFCVLVPCSCLAGLGFYLFLVELGLLSSLILGFMCLPWLVLCRLDGVRFTLRGRCLLFVVRTSPFDRVVGVQLVCFSSFGSHDLYAYCVARKSQSSRRCRDFLGKPLFSLPASGNFGMGHFWHGRNDHVTLVSVLFLPGPET